VASYPNELHHLKRQNLRLNRKLRAHQQRQRHQYLLELHGAKHVR
jgi:hypothetical protein